jgi:hypothetical protein
LRQRQNFIFELLLLGVLPNLSIAQQDVKTSAIPTVHHPYPIHGSQLLRKDELKLHNYIRNNPEVLKQATALHKTSAWGFTVNATKSWWATDMSNSSSNFEYSVPSTCRAIGNNCYIFVEDSSWTNGRVTQAGVDSILHAFEVRTPANSSKGIFQMDTTAFGQPPDVDSDSKVIILILNIKDGYTGSGGYVAGYFYEINEYTDAVIQSALGSNRHSNYAEIYYVDCNPANLTSTAGFEAASSTAAHEFQHMIHFNYTDFINNVEHQSFINEGCSVLAEVHCGYPIYDQSLYDGETNHTLFDWRTDDMTNVLKDYSRTARFFTYIRDQIGIGVFKNIVNSKQDGVACLDDAFNRFGSSQRFSSLLPNWFIANILNDTTVNTSYGYRYAGMPNVQSTPRYSISGLNTVEQYAAQYISFTGDSTTKIKFTSNSIDLFVKAVEVGTNSKRVLTVPINTDFSEPLFNSIYTQLYFVVYDTSGSTTATYSLNGVVDTTIVLRYDYTEPQYYISGNTNDTICVWFDAVSGGKLDSVRVALRSAGTMNGGIYTYSGDLRPTPLGNKLASISATVTKTPSTPYPIPWNNWGTADVRSSNISTSSPFAVAFVNQSGGTRIMPVAAPLPSTVTSYVYINDASSPNWFYYTLNDAGDSVDIWMIRAYVTLSSGSDTTIVAVPSAIDSLSQNFPNPFSLLTKTTIRFYLHTSGWVTLRVYDVLGREVMTCVNETLDKGTHTQTINTLRLASGVYFYRLQAGSFTQTKKMVLIK